MSARSLFEHPQLRRRAGRDLHRPDQARPGARHPPDARHPAAGRQVHPHRHQRQRRAADVPEGHGPDRERHGARHLRVQERASGPPCSASRTRASSTSPARAARRRSCAATKFDGPAAKVIAARARVMREHAGRLTGYALGQDHDDGQARRLLDDVLTSSATTTTLWCRDDRRAARRVVPRHLRRHHQGRRREPAARPRREGQARPRDRQGRPQRLRPGRRRGRRGGPPMRNGERRIRCAQLNTR